MKLILLLSILISSPLFAFKVGLDWVLNIQHGVLIYAKAKGYLPENTEFITHQSSSKALMQLSLGNVDLAISYEPNIAAAQKKGMEIEPFFDMVFIPLDVFVSRVPLANLKDKKIGHQSSPGSVSEKNLEKILGSVNLTLKDVETVFSLYDLSQGLLAHQYDAAMNIALTFAPELLKHEPSLKIHSLKEFGIHYKGQIIAQKKGAQNIVEPLARARKEVLKNPKYAWDIICKESPSLQTTVNEKRWYRYIDCLKECG